LNKHEESVLVFMDISDLILVSAFNTFLRYICRQCGLTDKEAEQKVAIIGWVCFAMTIMGLVWLTIKYS